ncbi:MAG TPA: hypothetical protein VFO34_08945 [Candidatus Acidoferrales bacterium]|nr:hypothetical protein [Candidatus Acidoferrales bacterium]
MSVQVKEKPPEQKQQYQAAMPQIPGVEAKGAVGKIPNSAKTLIAAGAAIAIVVLIIVYSFWRRHSSNSAADATAAPAAADAPVADLPPAPAPVSASGQIATKTELAAPWSSKEFIYRRPLDEEKIPALVVHLPGGSAQEPLYWGILLQAPYNHCELKFVSDPNSLAQQFGFRASHPMVVDTCNGSIFDPLKMGTLGDGSWTRGELVKGGDLRPPLAVEIKVEGDRLIAGRAEQ